MKTFMAGQVWNRSGFFYDPVRSLIKTLGYTEEDIFN
jgi:hypothetical protein